MELEINLKEGMGELLFGSNIEDVINKIGSPSEVEEIGEDIDYPTTILHYDDLGISLFFDINDHIVLSCIDIDNPDFCFQTGITASEILVVLGFIREGRIDRQTKTPLWC